MKKIELIEVASLQKKEYGALFLEFPFFHNYLVYALENLSFKIWIDSYQYPNICVFYSFPAFFLMGDPENNDVTSVLNLIEKSSWVIPENEKWEELIFFRFSNDIETHRRTKFNSHSLNIKHLETLKKPFSPEFELVQIGIEQVTDQKGMLFTDLLQTYFPTGDFLNQGFGYCILENKKMIGFAASNYPIAHNVLEVYIRVDFNSDPRHRQQGLGTQLSVALLEYCLNHNLNPEWDSANEISAHLALKLGYKIEQTWKMFHVI